MISTSQIEFSSIKDMSFDLLICSSGFESRSINVSKKLELKRIRHKIVVMFDNYRDELSRKENDLFFDANGFEFVESPSNSCDNLISKLTEILMTVKSLEINILIDYSCMSRVWYGELLLYFKYNGLLTTTYNLYFLYSMPKYVEPASDKIPNKYINPLNGYTSFSLPVLPTALVIGLGFEEDRGLGLIEYFDVIPYCLISEDSYDDSYKTKVVQSNSKLLESLPQNRLFYYPINNLGFTEVLINQLCKDLLINYRVVLAPTGPKPFTLMCFITALRLQNVDVWRISAGEGGRPINKHSDGRILAYKVTFLPD